MRVMNDATNFLKIRRQIQYIFQLPAFQIKDIKNTIFPTTVNVFSYSKVQHMTVSREEIGGDMNQTKMVEM